MRGGNAHDSVETVIAAANAIASAGSRVQQGSVLKRRWKAWFSKYLCFSSHGQTNRINHSVLVPEPTEGPSVLTHFNSNQSSLQVIAPPSSPSSFIQSEPPSITQSPTKFFSLSALAANSYSPTGSSIFAIGPYANDNKLVSPPVFSTFTTEPSTAPFTPPEPMQQTTPSSPEVPFAQLLSSSFDNKSYDLQPYQLHPGSPISHLISPRSVCSGTSSPFPDMELYPSTKVSMQPSKILSVQELAMRKLLNGHLDRHKGSILDGRITAIQQPDVEESGALHDDFEDEKIAFEFTAQEAAQCMKNQHEISIESHMDEATETSQKKPEKINHSSELGGSEEFKFNFENENQHDKNWAFFPLPQSGIR